MRLIGLDFETSGSDIDAGAVPIQIGIAFRPNPDEDLVVLDRYIGGWNWKDGSATWDKESEEVHGIPKEMLNDAPPAWKIDIALANELLGFIGPRMWNLPVGWNVGGFDMPFVRRYFPNLSRILSYRSVDLTPLVIALSGGHEGTYKEVKKQAKTWAANQIGGYQWHDAGFDAEAALHAYQWLTEHGLSTFVPQNFSMEAACRAYTHDYDMLPESQKQNVRRIIMQILEAGAKK